MVSNRRLIPVGPEAYMTPSWGTQALCNYITFEGDILEPCCGDGAMADVLKANGYTVHASDIYDHGYGEVRDFLTMRDFVDNIVTNPPFNVAETLLEHAIRLAKRKICFLLRTAFLESQRRYEMFYKNLPPNQLLVFTERLSLYPKGHEVNGGGTTSYSWFVWDMSNITDRTEIVWIEPGLKPKASCVSVA